MKCIMFILALAFIHFHLWIFHSCIHCHSYIIMYSCIHCHSCVFIYIFIFNHIFTFRPILFLFMQSFSSMQPFHSYTWLFKQFQSFIFIHFICLFPSIHFNHCQFPPNKILYIFPEITYTNYRNLPSNIVC